MTDDNSLPTPFAYADVSTMSADQAKAEQGRAISDPQFNRMLNAGGAMARLRAMNYLESLGQRQVAGGSQQFGRPGVTSADIKADERFQADMSGRNGAEAAANARNQLDAAERMEMASQVTLSDGEAAELHRLNTAETPNAYLEVAGLGMGEGEIGQQARQILFDHGISPIACKQLADAVPRADAMSDGEYDGAVDRARDHVMRMPGGPQIIESAVKFLNAMPDGHPLLRVAVAACADPRGLIEMSRLYAAGKGVRRT